MKIIVTGANGFLGSWVCRSFEKKGYDVSALVRKSADLSELSEFKGNLVYGDITEPDSLLKAFTGVEAIFHLAGVIAYRKSDRKLMEKVNVQGTENVLSAMNSCKVKKLLHVSSVVAIGAGFSPTEILTEESKFNLSHLNLGYFETKKKAEELVQQARKNYDIHPVIVNPSTIYGAGDAKKGSRKTQVKVAQGKFPFYTSGGVNVAHVEDVVNGIQLAFEKGRVGERYILAGENLTIQQLFQKIAKASGVKPPSIKMPNSVLHGLGFMGDRLQDIGLTSSLSSENAWTATMFHWFSAQKALSELGFKSRSADQAIEESVLWMKKNQKV